MIKKLCFKAQEGENKVVDESSSHVHMWIYVRVAYNNCDGGKTSKGA